MKTYSCTIKIVMTGSAINAKSKLDYIEKLKEDFFSNYCIELDDSEILDIEEIEDKEQDEVKNG